MSRIGIIGLGLVGSALAERLLQSGFAVLGFDVATDRCAQSSQLGVVCASSAAELFRACDRVVLSLPTSDEVGEVLAGVDVTGRAILDTTTGDPDAMEAIGVEVASRGGRYVVATVTGSSAQVRVGEVLVIVGGSEDAAGHCGDLLRAFARESVHVGGWGSAARMKLVVNLVLGLNRAVLAEGLAFAQACGIEEERALAVLMASAAFSRVMETKGRKMVHREFEPQARLAQHHKDVRLILDQAQQADASLPLSELHASLLARLMAEGRGDLDNSAIRLAFDPRPSTSP